MAVSELYMLLDKVLSSDPQDLCYSEKEVTRLSFHLRSTEPRDIEEIRDYIHNGISTRRFNRKNSELVLLYLENSLKGSAASLRLLTKGKSRSNRRKDEGEAPDSKRRMRETTYSELEQTPSEIMRSGLRESEFSGEETERSEKRTYGPFFPENEYEDRKGREKERNAALRIVVGDLERVHRLSLSAAFTRILVYKWQRQVSDTRCSHLSAMRGEVCKRLIAQYRRAEAYQKAAKVTQWKSAIFSGKHNVRAAMVKLLLRNSNSSFLYRKREAFEQWKQTTCAPGTNRNSHGDKAERMQRALTSVGYKRVRSVFAAARLAAAIRHLKCAGKALGNLNRIVNKQQFTPKSALVIWRLYGKACSSSLSSLRNSAFTRVLRLASILEHANKGEKQAILMWKTVTFPPTRLFPSLSEYKSAVSLIISRMSLRLSDSFRRWEVKSAVERVARQQKVVTGFIETLRKVLGSKARVCFSRRNFPLETQKSLDPALTFLYLFTKTAVKPISRSRGSLFLALRNNANRRRSAIEAIVRSSRCKVLKAFAYWKAVGKQKMCVEDTCRYMRAAAVLEHVGRTRKVQPFRLVSKLFPTVRRVVNRLSAASVGKVAAAARLWREFVEDCRESDRSAAERARKFSHFLLSVARKTYSPALRRVTSRDTVRAQLSLRLFVSFCLSPVKLAFNSMRDSVASNRQRLISAEYSAAVFQEKMKSAIRREKRISFLRVFDNRQKVIAAIRSFSLRIQAAERLAVGKWRQGIIRIEADQKAMTIKGQQMTKKLEKVARKQLKSGFVRKRETSISENGQKLVISLSRVPGKTMNQAFSLLFGKLYGNLLLTTVFHKLKTPLKAVLRRWISYAHAAKTAELEREVKGERLRNSLMRVATGRESEGLTRICRGSNKFLAAILTIVKGLDKPTRCAVKKWRLALETISKSTLTVLIKGEKAQKALLKSYKSALFPAFLALVSKPKAANSKGERLGKTLIDIGKKRLSVTYRRITSDNALLRRVFSGLMKIFREKPKSAFKLWRDFVAFQRKARERGEKLQRVAQKWLVRAYRSVGGSLFPRSQASRKSALRRLLLSVHRDLTSALRQWQTALLKREAAQLRSASRQSVRRTVPTSPSNSSRDDFASLFVDREVLVSARIGALVQIMKKVPRVALASWRNAVCVDRKRPQMDRKKAQKVRNALIKMLRRHIRSANFRSRGHSDMNKISAHLAAEKLRGMLNRVVLPAVRECFERVTRQGGSVRRAVRVVVLRLAQALRRVFRQWRLWAEKEKTGGSWDLFRGQKLRDCLSFVPISKTKTAFNHIFSRGSTQKHALKALTLAFKAAQRCNLATWKRNISLRVIYQDREIVVKDNRSAYRLLRSVDAAFTKWMRTAFNSLKLATGKAKEGGRKSDEAERLEKGTLGRTIHSLFGPVLKGTKEGLMAISAFARMKLTVKRLKGVHRIIVLSAKHSQNEMRPAVALWKDFVSGRRKHLLRRGVHAFIYGTSPSVQSSFWRWKIVKAYGELIFPHEFTFLRHTARILDRVQTRGLTKSFLFLSIGKRDLGCVSVRSQSPPLRFLRWSDAPSRKSSTITDEEDLISAEVLPTVVANKLSEVELTAVKKLGALETLGLRLRTVVARNASAAFVSIKDEGELRELRECNDMLMDDLTKLQQGSERLMETFNESTQNLEQLSKKLDVLKTERLVRILEKVSAQVPLLEALFYLKLHAGFSVSF